MVVVVVGSAHFPHANKAVGEFEEMMTQVDTVMGHLGKRVSQV